jgi:hypothetical protein
VSGSDGGTTFAVGARMGVRKGGGRDKMQSRRSRNRHLGEWRSREGQRQIQRRPPRNARERRGQRWPLQKACVRVEDSRTMAEASSARQETCRRRFFAGYCRVAFSWRRWTFQLSPPMPPPKPVWRVTLCTWPPLRPPAGIGRLTVRSVQLFKSWP